MNPIEQNIRRNPAILVCVLFGAGIILGWYFISNIPVIPIIAIVITFLLTAFCWKKVSLYFLIPVFVLIGTLSIHLALSTFPTNHLLFQNNTKVEAIEGWISDAQYRKDGKHRYILETQKLIFDSTEKVVCGKILLFQGKNPSVLKYGQRIRFNGLLKEPSLPGNPGEFNFRKYLHLKDIFFQAVLSEENYIITAASDGSRLGRYVLVPIRNFIRNTIEHNVPEPTASVVKALVLGERQDIERGILEQFQRTGIVHVLAISGLHVGFILMLFLLIFGLSGISYNKQIILSLLLLFAFVALVNFKAPVLRAALMAALYYSANWGERKVSPLNTIAVAGLLILIFDPAQILLPGFQFSFAAVGGILYGYPRLKSNRIFRFKNHLFQKWLVQPFLVSLAAVLSTTPLTWWYYGTLQTGAVLINVLLIPLIGLFVVLNFIFILSAALGLGINEGFGQMLHFYFSFIFKLNGLFTEIPFIQVQASKPEGISILLLIALVLLIFQLNRKNILYALSLLILLVFINTRTEPRFRLTFVNVGQGDGAIVEFPNGKVLVVDAGDRKFGFDAGTRYMLPLLKHYGIRKIDYLAATHAHSDHFGGMLKVLDGVVIDTVILSPYQSPNKLYQQFLTRVQSLDIPIIYKQRGQQIAIGKDYRVYVLHPFGQYLQAGSHSGNEVNNSSLVLKICYGNTSFLLTGDLEQNAERDIVSYQTLLDADVLKVGHHGSRTSSSADFLDRVTPEYSIVSVGKRNRFFHPSRETINRLRMNRAHPLRTDHFGALVFESDGKEVQLVNWR